MNVGIHFWATWCAPCVQELEELEQIHDEFGGQLQLLGICLDTSDSSSVKEFLAQRSVNWPQVHDGLGFQSPVVEHFGLQALPAVVVFDTRGRPRYVHRGQLRTAVTSLIDLSEE